MNTAPDSVDAGWSDKVGAFFTFGPGSTNAIYILTALGFIFFVVALVGWIYLEDQKLTHQVETLRKRGLATESMPGVSQAEGS